MAGKSKQDYLIEDYEWLVNSVFRDVMLDQSKRVWVLGAGASIDSGIDAAAVLTHEWACHLAGCDHRATKIDDIEEHWKADPFLSELLSKKDNKQSTYAFLGEMYFKVYGRRFGHDPRAGYNDLRKRMAGKTPSIGYHILAQLLGTKSNLIVTLNFDSLIVDALFLTGKHTPLVLDHEDIAHLANPDGEVPMVLKIHRDVLKNPQSTDEEMASLNEKWKEPLDEIFKRYSPIFIGYGGNDHTLMTYLSSRMTFDSRPIWLHYTNAINLDNHDNIRKEVSAPIADFLTKSNGILVPYTGFDRLMNFAQKRLGLPEVVEQFRERVEAITSGLEQKLQELAKEEGKAANTDPISQSSVDVLKTKSNRSLNDWVTLASKEKNPAMRARIYDRAIAETRHSWLYNNRGIAKHDMQQYDEAIADYDEASRLDPLLPSAPYNKACTFAQMKDVPNAIDWLGKAIELDAVYIKKAKTDSDFDSIRDMPEFKSLIAKYEGKS